MGFLSLLSNMLSVVQTWLGMQRDAQLREDGANEERLSSMEKAREAEKAMDNVHPSGKSDIVDRLRNGGF